MTLTFEGDSTTVLPFAVQGSKGPVYGYINLVGTATFFISGANNFSAQGTFLPSAGIFVSVDNSNGGVGFGSFGVSPSDPNFLAKVQGTYPAGIIVGSTVATYDLKSDFSADGFAISWFGFPTPVTPGSPGPPLPISTPGMSAGELILNQTGISAAVFLVKTQGVTPFASLSVGGEIESERFDLQGRFSLGATSNGINPLSEAVALQLDSYSVTIPPGSFKRSGRGGYEYEGRIADVRLNLFLKAKSPSDYRFEFEGAGEGLPRLAKPVSMTLTIGDDSGTTTVKAESE